ncbi:hypothetical protein OPV22_017407 [Ensete ventricosum]|nr:hypothetical protein OPV22_017407 [Ensete ventricosum]
MNWISDRSSCLRGDRRPSLFYKNLLLRCSTSPCYKYSSRRAKEKLHQPPVKTVMKETMGLFGLLFWCSLLFLAFYAAEGRLDCKIELGSCWNPETAPPANGRKVHGAWKVELKQGCRRPPDVELAAELPEPELMRVPSGPDPLHHNGSPKKPQTP